MKIVTIITSFDGASSAILSTSVKPLAKSEIPFGGVYGFTVVNGNFFSTNSSVFFSPLNLGSVVVGL